MKYKLEIWNLRDQNRKERNFCYLWSLNLNIWPFCLYEFQDVERSIQGLETSNGVPDPVRIMSYFYLWLYFYNATNTSKNIM